jgi:hypothetical protein
MPFHKALNNYSLTLFANIGTIDTSFQVVESTAELTTAINENKEVFLSIGTEVVSVTAVNGQTITVLRGEDGTTPSSHNANDLLECFVVAEQINELHSGFDSKVDKVVGYGLSQEDFTGTLKTKLDGIESGAQVNPIKAVLAEAQAGTDDTKFMTPYGVKEAINAQVTIPPTSVYGTVHLISKNTTPNTNATTTYTVQATHNFGSLPTGRYAFFVKSVFNHDSANGTGQVKFEYDVGGAVTLVEEYQKEPKDGADIIPMDDFDEIVVASQSNVSIIISNRSLGSGSCTVLRSKAMLWRVS